jgi:Kdo2-lipid IVA lauroyltransferase/acyltransferase
MARQRKHAPKPLRWRLECLAHSFIEVLAGLLPGPWVFRMGEALGGLAWHLMPLRRRMVLRNLRIAFAGEMELPEIRRMARATFRRSGANLVSAAYTSRLSPDRLHRVVRIENRALLDEALAAGKGVVLLLAHMGNWELLSRVVHLFPEGSKTGAFYRPLDNPQLDARVLARRQADGTRMFSKRDPFHQPAGFLREGGIVGILADQRVGKQGELVRFFGRLTRATPLPSLLARRTKSHVLALSLATERPGKWKATFLPVAAPPTTANCMAALESAMQASPLDVFWLQERWKLFQRPRGDIQKWLGPDAGGGLKPIRILLWLVETPASWRLPELWFHPEARYEVALAPATALPAWLPADTPVHRASPDGNLRRAVTAIDESTILPLDLILATGNTADLAKACHLEAVPVISLP